MTEQFGPFGLSREEETRRQENVNTVRRFMEIKGPDRNVRRLEICNGEGGMILPFERGGNPREAEPVPDSWQDLAARYLEGVHLDEYPDWSLSPLLLHETPDPDTVFVECEGQAMRHRAGDMERGEYTYYQNHYLLKFTFREGKIHYITEFFNPAAVWANNGMNREPMMY